MGTVFLTCCVRGLEDRTRPLQLQAGAEAIFAETGAGSDLAR